MIRLVTWLGCSNRTLSVAILLLLLAPSIEAADFRVLSAQEPTISDIARHSRPSGAQFEFTLAAIAQNLRRLAKIVGRPPPAIPLRAA
jgi:hypothetical protein